MSGESSDGVPRELPTRPSTLVQIMRPNSALIILGLIASLAVVESIAAALAYREHIDADDWDGAAALLKQHQGEGEPLFVASTWLGPTARMTLPQAARREWVGAPDLRGLGRYWLLTEAHTRPFSGRWRAELEDLPTPELVALHRLGGLSLHEYRAPGAAQLRYALLETLDSEPGTVEMHTAQGRCSGRAGRWRCKAGAVSRRLMEIDYRARDCLALALDDGATLELDIGRVELGNRLRGHVGFGDFNARLRSDAVAQVEAYIDDELAARWLFTDDQGWASFALATPTGAHDLRLRVGTTIGGTWQRDGRQPSPTDTLCLELRSFLEPGDSEARP